jgi:enoyl-CoA hydratase/carnithine racemase
MSAERAAAAVAKMDARNAKAPESVLSIPTTVRYGHVPLRTSLTPDRIPHAGAAIRQVGCTRRVFLLNPYLTSTEVNGLAHRIEVLGRNSGINSVLIATNDDDDLASGALPSSAVEAQRTKAPFDLFGTETGFGKVWHCAGGYDALDLYTSGAYKDPAQVDQLLTGIRNLALATRGVTQDEQNNTVPSMVPVITVPHGLVNDGGYALCMGSYVMATRDSTFAIKNPAKGLSFDPVGFSFLLPRLGWEYSQVSADYPVGKMLALTGMEAQANDMLETGLATHYMGEPSKLAMLERTLGELPPWDQQKILQQPAISYDEIDELDDCNEEFRNVAVGHCLHTFARYDAASQEIWNMGEIDFREQQDPSLVLESEAIGMNVERSSDIVTWAATFEDIFARESSVHGIIERLKEVSSKHDGDEEDRQVAKMAGSMVEKMERRAPLALSAIFKLMEMGRPNLESLESCMEREKKVQQNLIAMEDYQNWAKAAASASASGNKAEPFTAWKHKSVKEVSNDEVEQLLG